jgi:hypothetical protein
MYSPATFNYKLPTLLDSIVGKYLREMIEKNWQPLLGFDAYRDFCWRDTTMYRLALNSEVLQDGKEIIVRMEGRQSYWVWLGFCIKPSAKYENDPWFIGYLAKIVLPD